MTEQVEIDAPIWGEALNDQQKQDIKKEYGPLANGICELIEMIKEAHKLFGACIDPGQNAQDPGDHPLDISNFNEPLIANTQIDGIIRELVMQQSQSTYRPVVRLLYSAIALKDPLEELTSNHEEAKQFYDDLKTNMRFYKGEIDETAYTSGDVLYGGRTGWKYMGVERQGIKTSDLIAKLTDVQNGGDKLEQLPSEANVNETNGETDTKLTPAAEKAYQSYCHAEKRSGLSKDKEVYGYLKENPFDGYDLPAFETWSRNVRSGRNHYGTKKNTPRGGRSARAGNVTQEPGLLKQISNQYVKPD